MKSGTAILTSREIWPEIKKQVVSSRADVAVAYFGEGASTRLPLAKGSNLVVDASDRTVAAGLTCPNDLEKLLDRGVRIYNQPRLHAKVFVFRSRVFVGSNNASSNSENALIDAAVSLCERRLVSDARAFVQSMCKGDGVGPEQLDRLKGVYQKPKGGFGGALKKAKASNNEDVPLRIARLVSGRWSERDTRLDELGFLTAQKYCKHPRAWITESFRWYGVTPLQRGHQILQIVKQPDGRMMVHPAGTVLNVQRDRHRNVSIVHLERTARRRVDLKTFCKRVGCNPEQLARSGLVSSPDLRDKLLSKKNR